MDAVSILGRLGEFEEKIAELSDILLANLVMISEIPAPTFREQQRVEFLLNRFNEYQLQNCSTDEVDNALGIIPGERGDRNLLIVAHMDTVFPESVDHTITIQPGFVVGPGVGDNGLGLAALATLPLVLEQLNIRLDANLILMGSSRSLGKGNIEGLKFFLSNSGLPVAAGVVAEGVLLGRLSYSSIGMLRGRLTARVPEEYDWTRFGAGGAIVNMNEVINAILEIPLPRRPRTTIVLGTIEGGSSFNTIATHASLQFEIRSESGDMVQKLSRQIEDIAAEVSSGSGAEVSLDVLARREPGGIGFSHPLARGAREIMGTLGIQPWISPSTSELSAFIDRRIPAITVGLTRGEHLNEENETIEIPPIAKGMAQLLGIILAMDRRIHEQHQ